MKKIIVALALAIGVGALAAQAPVALAVRGRSNANVSLAASGPFVAAVWSASIESGDADIYAAVSRNAGASFSAPVRVNGTVGSARAGGEQPPRVALVPRAGADPAIVVVWTARGSAGTRLLTAKSIDGGRTFPREAVVPGSDGAGNRGWEAIAADRAGRIDLVWLDHREGAAPAGSGDMSSHHMEHMTTSEMQADSVAKAQLSKLYFASLGDAGVQGRALFPGVCYCCKTSIAVGADGVVYAAWRHVYPGNIRDIAFTSSKDGGKTFSPAVRVSEDKWAIDGCPENGPSLAVDARHAVHLAWPTVVAGSGAAAAGTLNLFYTVSHDGRQFTPRQAVPTMGTPRHVQIATDADGSVLLAWDEAGSTGRRIAFARGVVQQDGHVNFTRRTVAALGEASYPALALTSNGPLLAAASSGDTDTVIRFASVGR